VGVTPSTVIGRPQAGPSRVQREPAGGPTYRGRASGPTVERWLGLCALAVVAMLACSPLDAGYFGFGAWGPLALAAMAVLVALIWVSRPNLSRPGLVAAGALALLLVLSAASMIWAESKELAWTDTNRLALYCVIFAIVLLAVRTPRIARIASLMLGASALATSAWVVTTMVLGAAGGGFLVHRLSAPIGYINGTAGMLAMGLWTWLGCAETARRPQLRGLALAATSLVASTAVLTQSRALVLAVVIGATAVLIPRGGRTIRAVNLIVTAISVAAALPWTLAVYTAGGIAGASSQPTPASQRQAALAILATAAGAGLAAALIGRVAQRLDPGRRARIRRRVGATLAVSVIGAIVVGGVLGGPWLVRQYEVFVGSHKAPAVASVRFVDASGFRYDLWRIAAREFRSHPLLGLGAGNYDTDYYRLRHNSQYVLQPHSLEMQMAAELGVGGIVALCLFCGAVLWAAVAGRGTLASGDRLVRVAASGAFVAWLACTSVDWLYDIPGVTGLAVVAAGLLVVTPGRAGAPARPRAVSLGPVARKLLAAGAVAAVAVTAAGVGRQYVANRLATSGSSDATRSPASALSELRKSLSLDPFALPTLYSMAAAYAARDDYADARATLLKAAAREPDNYVPPALLGDLAVRRGLSALAASEYRRALALNPRDLALQQSLAATRAEG